MSNILIKDGLVVTTNREMRIIRNGAVAIEGDRIADVGKTFELERKYGSFEKINAKNMAVLPGLIDAHAHLVEALHRGLMGDLSLIDWLTKRSWPLSEATTEQDAKIGASLCCLEMIKSGTTCFVEPMLHSKYNFDEVAKVIDEVGIRGVLAKALMGKVGYGLQEKDMSGRLREKWESSLNETINMIKRWNGKAQGRIKVWLGPRVMSACTPELGHQIAGIAEKFNVGITVHCAEVKEDVNYVMTEYGMSPAEFLQEIGLLDTKVLLAHAIWLTAKDIDMIANAGAKVVHNPSSNMKLASGFAKIPDMLKQGVVVGLGCDGGMSGGCYDMFREMKIAALIHKGVTSNPSSITDETVLRMATINGARALNWDDEIGSIEIGKKADIILVDLKKPHMVPLTNTVSNLVYSAVGCDVDTTIINGRLIMQNRHVLTMDEEKVLDEAQSRALKFIQTD